MRRRRAVPSLRRWRRAALIELAAILALGGTVLRGADKPSEAAGPPEETPPVHIITLEPSPTPVTVWVRYPAPIEDGLQRFIEKVCGEYGIDPALVMAVIEVESGGDRLAVSEDGEDFGLMQIRARWHGERMSRLGVADILDAADNVRVGVDYLAELYATHGDAAWVLMAYHGGESYADDMTAAGEVSAYARRVLMLAECYDEGAQTVTGIEKEK